MEKKKMDGPLPWVIIVIILFSGGEGGGGDVYPNMEKKKSKLMLSLR